MQFFLLFECWENMDKTSNCFVRKKRTGRRKQNSPFLKNFSAWTDCKQTVGGKLNCVLLLIYYFPSSWPYTWNRFTQHKSSLASIHFINSQECYIAHCNSVIWMSVSENLKPTSNPVSKDCTTGILHQLWSYSAKSTGWTWQRSYSKHWPEAKVWNLQQQMICYITTPSKVNCYTIFVCNNNYARSDLEAASKKKQIPLALQWVFSPYWYRFIFIVVLVIHTIENGKILQRKNSSKGSIIFIYLMISIQKIGNESLRSSLVVSLFSCRREHESMRGKQC